MSANPIYSEPGNFQRASGNDGTRSDEVGRQPFRKDFARLLHAPSFRRLQGKTQLFPGTESDFFRNRLTHSLEVAQIAKGIAAKLNQVDVPRNFVDGSIDEDLVEFASIAHDLGHPPFGHNGEHALDELMRGYGGFEGNAQTLRILAAVEQKLVTTPSGTFSADFGLDLTYRALAAVLKYDAVIPVRRGARSKLQKGYYASEQPLVQKVKKAVAPRLRAGMKFKTIECAIMDIADDIAYSTYDLEDSLHGGFITPLALANAIISDQVLRDEVQRKTNAALIAAKHAPIVAPRELLDVVVSVFGIAMPDLARKAMDGRRSLKSSDAVDLNVDAWRFDRALAENGLARTRLTAVRVGRLISAVELVPNKQFPQLSGIRMKRAELLQVEVLKHLNFALVIRSPRLAVVEHRGKEVVQKIFRAVEQSKGALLPVDWSDRYEAASSRGKGASMRVICDYVACMTDRYAAELHQRLFDEGPTIFKPL